MSISQTARGRQRDLNSNSLIHQSLGQSFLIYPVTYKIDMIYIIRILRNSRTILGATGIIRRRGSRRVDLSFPGKADIEPLERTTYHRRDDVQSYGTHVKFHGSQTRNGKHARDMYDFTDLDLLHFAGT